MTGLWTVLSWLALVATAIGAFIYSPKNESREKVGMAVLLVGILGLINFPLITLLPIIWTWSAPVYALATLLFTLMIAAGFAGASISKNKRDYQGVLGAIALLGLLGNLLTLTIHYFF